MDIDVNQNVFVVTAYRYADKEAHSYVVGVFEQQYYACGIAEKEKDCRGGKYDCEVIKVELNIWKDGNRKIIKSLEV